ncbi:hypothetical protein CBP51_05630 [Cellvibrio mixtus]|uniref:RiboL-PSP-HEPN domain-containing protein n=1 Tax=Cellvibrio mixtus TaxID=39650 RepID=A0A266Q9E4_9GAMM|nr:hypothetical protein [Cellvibrio mixtus]OZY86504.1 hypothetical protein CBP51_05630 [Cellvibrio mixtus]
MSEIFDKEKLSGEEIQNEVFRRMEKYNEKSFLEQFAIYLGTAQILEFGLKKLLITLFNATEENLERKTLGQTRVELEKRGIRADYTELLKEVVSDRNYAAHELLSNNALLNSFNVTFSENMQFKELKHFIYKLEQAVLIFDYIQHSNAWLIKA